jgi:hypothetical protein
MAVVDAGALVHAAEGDFGLQINPLLNDTREDPRCEW